MSITPTFPYLDTTSASSLIIDHWKEPDEIPDEEDDFSTTSEPEPHYELPDFLRPTPRPISPTPSIPTPVRPIYNMSFERIRPYTGELDEQGHAEDPQSWVCYFNKCAHQQGWTTDEEKLLHVSTCFAGEADVWYETDPDWMEDEGRTWDEFIDRFVT